MSHVVQLEAFEAPLRNRRIRWFLAPGSPITYPPGFQEQCFIESPPFQRRILLTTHASSEAWKLVDRWDAMFVPATPQDWSLILTVALNQPPPCLIIATPEVRIPPAFFQRCQAAGAKAPTIVCFQTLQLPAPPAPVTMDATFFPPSKHMDDTLMEATQAALQQLLSSDTMRNFVLKDAIRDLKSAGATIAVSIIGDEQPTLYWYYASEQSSKKKDLFASIVQTLLARD
jgi:hypothetical protein